MWWEDYIGREYIVGEYDCAHLVVDIQQNVFGNDFEVMVERDRSLRIQSEQIHQNLDKYVYPIDASEAADGDMLLMKCKGVLNHTGIVATNNNVKYVIHNLRNIRSVAMHKIRELPRYGLEIEGYYRFKSNDKA